MKRLAIAICPALLCVALASEGRVNAVSSAESASAAPSDPGDPGDQGSIAAARKVVESLHEALLGCMKDGLGFPGRYERIVSNLDQTFDLPFMARAAITSAWNELSPQERAEFIELSRRLSASRYADNFSSYGGERFETLTVEPAARGTIVVKTQFVQPKDKTVKFDYRLRHGDSGWRVIDVQLEGTISELAIRRGQYRSVIEKDGFPALVEEIEERIEELSQD